MRHVIPRDRHQLLAEGAKAISPFPRGLTGLSQQRARFSEIVLKGRHAPHLTSRNAALVVRIKHDRHRRSRARIAGAVVGMRTSARSRELQDPLGLRDLLIERSDLPLFGLELFLVANKSFEFVDRLGASFTQFVQLLIHHWSPNSGRPQASPRRQVSDFRSVSAQPREASRSRRTRRARISDCGTSSEACSGSSSLPSPSASGSSGLWFCSTTLITWSHAAMQ